MPIRTVLLRGLSVPAALVISLALAGQSFGAIWSGPVTVAAAAVADGMVTLGSSTAVALFHDNTGLYMKRSTDSGASWETQRRLTSTVGCEDPSATIAGSGRKVDVAWMEFPDCGGGQVVYRRSTDRAQTFGQRILIATDPIEEFDRVSVARGPNNVVAILWEEIQFCVDDSCDQQRTTYRIRVSTDGGLSFGETRTVASTLNEFSGGSALAIGDGVIYVAYLRGDSVIRLRRSLDDGSSWSTAKTMSQGVVFDDVAGPYLFEMTATGSRAAIAYIKRNDPGVHLLLRYTANSGASWSAPVGLSSVDRRDVWSHRLTWQGGTLRVAFTRCPLNCDGSRLLYRASADGGATWTPAQVVIEGDSPAAIGFAGQILVLLNSGSFDPVLVMRGAAT